MAAFALATAIPVIDKIVTAIFPKPGDKEKKTKKEATDAVAADKSSSAAALKALGDELTLVAQLLTSCLPAEDGIVRMKAFLDAKKAEKLTKSDELAIQKGWDIVKESLQDIKQKETKTAVSALSDEFTKSTFLDVINADTKGIDSDLKAWAMDELRDDVNELYKALNKVNKVASQVIGGLAKELTKASTAQGKTSGATPPSTKKASD